MYSEQYYRTLAFLAGFGAAGALGCDAVMEEEKPPPEPSLNHEIKIAHQPVFHHNSGRRLEATVAEE